MADGHGLDGSASGRRHGKVGTTTANLKPGVGPASLLGNSNRQSYLRKLLAIVAYAYVLAIVLMVLTWSCQTHGEM